MAIKSERKSVKSIRKAMAKDGVFYTPSALAELAKGYIGFEPRTVYDPTCGDGALLRIFTDDVHKYGQEIDADELQKIDLPNFHGAAGDTLTDDAFAGMEFDAVIANPPFSVAYDQDAAKVDPRFEWAGALPMKSKADWCFIMHCLAHTAEHGVAVVICFPGALYRSGKEAAIRKAFIDRNYVDRVVSIPEGQFEDTGIATCILVLRKDRTATDVTFEEIDTGLSSVVSPDRIAENDYNLTPRMYIDHPDEREEIDIDAVNQELYEIGIRNEVREAKKTAMLATTFGWTPTLPLSIAEVPSFEPHENPEGYALMYGMASGAMSLRTALELFAAIGAAKDEDDRNRILLMIAGSIGSVAMLCEDMQARFQAMVPPGWAQ